MKKIIINLVAAVVAGWSAVFFFAMSSETTQPWIFICLGIFCIITAIHYVLEAIRVKFQ